MFDVVALGELLIDFVCESVDNDGYPTMAAHPGGAPANFLAAISKYGMSTSFIGKVGNDTFGNLLYNTIVNAKICPKGIIKCDDAFTTLAFVTLDQYGNRGFSFSRKPGADMMLKSSEINYQMLRNTRVFHFGSLSLSCEPSRTATMKALAAAKDSSSIISFDPNFREPLWDNVENAKQAMLWGLGQADIVKISVEEANFLFGLAAEESAAYIHDEYGVKLVYVTCGRSGCYYRGDNASGFVPAIKNIKVVDTTGAGDIFGGSAMWKLLQSKKKLEELTSEDLDDICRFAAVAAGLSTTKFGGISSIPSLSEVYEALPLVCES